MRNSIRHHALRNAILADVTLHGIATTAHRFDVSDDFIGGIPVGQVVDSDIRASLCGHPCGSGTDAAASAGDEDVLSSEVNHEGEVFLERLCQMLSEHHRCVNPFLNIANQSTSSRRPLAGGRREAAAGEGSHFPRCAERTGSA